MDHLSLVAVQSIHNDFAGRGYLWPSVPSDSYTVRSGRGPCSTLGRSHRDLGLVGCCCCGVSMPGLAGQQGPAIVRPVWHGQGIRLEGCTWGVLKEVTGGLGQRRGQPAPASGVRVLGSMPTFPGPWALPRIYSTASAVLVRWHGTSSTR